MLSSGPLVLQGRCLLPSVAGSLFLEHFCGFFAETKFRYNVEFQEVRSDEWQRLEVVRETTDLLAARVRIIVNQHLVINRS